MTKGTKTDYPDELHQAGSQQAGLVQGLEPGRLPSRHEPDGRSRLQDVLLAVVLAGCVAGLAILLGSSQAVTGGKVAHHWETMTLLVISLFATAAYLVIFVALHLLSTGYSPVRHAVSDYGVGRSAPLFRIGLYASSVGVLALAFALMRGVGSPPLATRDLMYLMLIPVARVGMSLVPTNLEGERLTRTGLLHYVFAVAAFTLTYLAISGTTSVLRASDLTIWLRNPIGWVAWLVAPELALVVLTLLRPLRKVFGLAERLFLVTTNVWFVLVALLVIGRIA